MVWLAREGCEVGYFDYEPTRTWCEGIVYIHRNCTPPCPRKRAADHYLKTHATGVDSHET